MTNKINFDVMGEPRGKGRPRFARQGNFVRTYTDNETVLYENWVKTSFLNSCCEPIWEGALNCRIEVYCPIPKSVSKKKSLEMILGIIRPTKKPDCDNIAKTILDGLNKVAFTDDTQIVELVVKKFYTQEEPKVNVFIEETRIV